MAKGKKMKLDKNLRVPVTSEEEQEIKAEKHNSNNELTLRAFYRLLLLEGLKSYKRNNK